jgi:predicted nucleic acid-binding protein
MKNAWLNWKTGEIASVDTNILVYAAAEPGGAKTDQARWLLRELGARQGLISVQSLGEFFVVATRKYRVQLDAASRVIELWQNAFPTVAASPAALNRAIRIVDGFGLQFWDALLIATVAEKGVTVLFSEDMQNGQIINGVHIINPFDE